MSVTQHTFLRGLAFSAASAAAVCFPFLLRELLWPEGLVAWADNVFWPATGVNVAGLLILGTRFWPVLLLNALPAWLLLGHPLGGSLLGASTNAAEAVLAAWALRRFGGFDGTFDRMRPLVILLVVSFIAPLVNTLTFPAYLVATGALAPANYVKALANWNLANGDAMLLLTPFLVTLARRAWTRPARSPIELGAWAFGGLVCGGLALNAVFGGAELNYAFLLFPFVIFVALRHGVAEVSAALVGVMALVYALMVWHARELPTEQMPAILWFIQAFCWALSATGLLGAALIRERRVAAERARVGERRSLEANLREEQARLQALRYQVSPHFLFNALNSLRSTLPDSAPVPRNMIDALSTYLRGSLEHTDRDTLPLENELASIRGYLDIEKIRFGDELQIVFDIAPDTVRASVPVFLLQPLVENAIRHGFNSAQGTFHLRLAARRENDRLCIEVANSGDWVEPSASSGRTGLGLENIRRRLQLLHGASASLDRHTADGWVRFHIRLPFSLCVVS